MRVWSNEGLRIVICRPTLHDKGLQFIAHISQNVSPHVHDV